jgi:hypothetical protein
MHRAMEGEQSGISVRMIRVFVGETSRRRRGDESAAAEWAAGRSLVLGAGCELPDQNGGER